MGAYYNEIEPYAAQWLRNLIKAGHIAEGDVDERSIVEVEASDLRKYDQCHFFAGIGVWSYALRSAGWADDRKVWTGSCPCQPFSVAGLGQGFADERHLWPVWAKLIEQCRPDVIFGEQVANNDALAWLDVVQAYLEAADYAVGTIDLCAAGLGAPHLRQRLWWVADATGARRRVSPKSGEGRGDETRDPRTDGTHARLREPERDRAFGELANPTSNGRGEERQVSGRDVEGDRTQGRAPGLVPGRDAGVVGNPYGTGPQVRPGYPDGRRAVRIEGSAAAETGAVSGYWGSADLIYCRDPGGHRYRPVEPGTFPLAHGVANCVGRLRATGNALVAPVAEAFVRAYMDVATGCG
jgi:DNA (cytosine-5)-methyltransferase 1